MSEFRWLGQNSPPAAVRARQDREREELSNYKNSWDAFLSDPTCPLHKLIR
jgi:hypothetical protein